MKYTKTLLILVLVSILACTFASATVTIEEVELDDDELEEYPTSNYVLAIEKGDEVEVKVHVISNESIDNVKIDAELESKTFDMKADVTYVKKLNIKLTKRMEQDRYTLYVDVRGRYSDHDSKTYLLEVDAPKHALELRDIILSPENEVKAGRALLVTARIKNRGEEQEEDIKVRASVPALGISASDYIDELDEEDCDDEDCDDSTTSEELYMRIPDCAEPGVYTVKVCVEYDDGDEEECETTKINVIGSDTCSIPTQKPIVGKTLITIGPDTQDISKSGSAMYPITISNQGLDSKVYAISTDSADWADFTITPSNILVVGEGESKAAYISLKAKPTATGLQLFSVTIKSGESVLKQVPLRANILGGTAAPTDIGSIKRVLEIGLVILVVLLVILGLIIGFNKLKGSEEETEEEKTYY
jgi:hypothetical protein